LFPMFFLSLRVRLTVVLLNLTLLTLNKVLQPFCILYQ
jgi:hypothetical protein